MWWQPSRQAKAARALRGGLEAELPTWSPGEAPKGVPLPPWPGGRPRPFPRCELIDEATALGSDVGAPTLRPPRQAAAEYAGTIVPPNLLSCYRVSSTVLAVPAMGRTAPPKGADSVSALPESRGRLRPSSAPRLGCGSRSASSTGPRPHGRPSSASRWGPGHQFAPPEERHSRPRSRPQSATAGSCLGAGEQTAHPAVMTRSGIAERSTRPWLPLALCRVQA
mmetsp:Transcript_110981/g.237206  ORF Transcript_110981/g.237206 Transcript_110981/m.237206 type:complete len:223 (+) Transcript_110981:131-799(+)